MCKNVHVLYHMCIHVHVHVHVPGLSTQHQLYTTMFKVSDETQYIEHRSIFVVKLIVEIMG